MRPPPNTESLPENARLLAGRGVWHEGEAIDQLGRVARLPDCIRAVGLPDLHAGPGIPIGAAIALDGVIRPHLVGGDAGCGVRLYALPRLRVRGDALERRVRDFIDGPPLPEVDPAAALRAAWRHGPGGLGELKGLPASLAELVSIEPEEPAWLASHESSPPPDRPHLGSALGTVGGGNHFLEASEISAITDRNAAARLGLKRGGAAVLAHSGSRGVGRLLAERWGDVELRGKEQTPYLADLAGAVRFARTNRLVLCWRMLEALGAARVKRLTGVMDITHNTVLADRVGPQAAWVHRKGAAPANRDQLTIVLGSRGTPSWLMEGEGNPDWLCSVAHGAGRKMGRNEAISKLRTRYRRSALTRTELGGRVICDERDLLYAEHPDAYKDIESVVSAIEEAAVARRVAALTPLVTVKR